MPPDVPRATPEQLAEAPELAALEILDCAADVASRALLADSPELLERDFLLEHAAVTPQLCLGAAVLSAIVTLTVAVERYRVHLEQLASLRLRETGEPPLLNDQGDEPPAIATTTALHREVPHPDPALNERIGPTRPSCAVGSGEELRRNHRRGPGYPVIPVIRGPRASGGDTRRSNWLSDLW